MHGDQHAIFTWHNLEGAVQPLVDLGGDDLHPWKLLADPVDALRCGDKGEEHNAGLQDTLVQQHLNGSARARARRESPPGDWLSTL